mmetsp:Transcript_4389/g.12835  ORF Transcript_4389/g.12835 Transcript_4389/m.12835 type:complete len:243 (+) Transcript_4389:298-1026(+)
MGRCRSTDNLSGSTRPFCSDRRMRFSERQRRTQSWLLGRMSARKSARCASSRWRRGSSPERCPASMRSMRTALRCTLQLPQGASRTPGSMFFVRCAELGLDPRLGSSAGREGRKVSLAVHTMKRRTLEMPMTPGYLWIAPFLQPDDTGSDSWATGAQHKFGLLQLYSCSRTVLCIGRLADLLVFLPFEGVWPQWLCLGSALHCRNPTMVRGPCFPTQGATNEYSRVHPCIIGLQIHLYAAGQ